MDPPQRVVSEAPVITRILALLGEVPPAAVSPPLRAITQQCYRYNHDCEALQALLTRLVRAR